MGSASPHRTRRRTVAGLLALMLIASACGGASSGGGTTTSEAEEGSLSERGFNAAAGESGLEEAGEPVRGGKLVYGVEADSNSYCLSEGQLAISGMLVVRAVYDTLTIPNAEGDYVPYLAKAVTPNDTYDEWTIELREGIEFHDGSPLTAEVVKNNLDAFRGEYEGRSSLLFAFILRNIDEIEVLDDLRLVVRTEVPWVAFPAFLYSSSRVGIMAQAQLDDPNCSTNLIGTGPFKFKSWNENEKFEAVRNEDYWQIAPDGEPYPYADAIEFRIIADSVQRPQALMAGDIDLMHTGNSKDIVNRWAPARDRNEVNMFVSEEHTEVGFLQLNNSKPPFDDIRMRKALAMALDRDELSRLMNDGLPTRANGPISPGSFGYVDDIDFPEYDPDEAKRLVEEYVAEGNDASFVMTMVPDPESQRYAQLLQTRVGAVGIEMTLANRDQAALINDSISKNYQMGTFRNYPGGDPDELYVWFHSGGIDDEGKAANPVNFSGIADETIDDLLDAGRSEPDTEKRREMYEDLNRRMGTEVFNIWTSFTPWAIITKAPVHGILGPALPGEDHTEPIPLTIDDPARQPSLGLATAHSLIGLWTEN